MSSRQDFQLHGAADVSFELVRRLFGGQLVGGLVVDADDAVAGVEAGYFRGREFKHVDDHQRLASAGPIQFHADANRSSLERSIGFSQQAGSQELGVFIQGVASPASKFQDDHGRLEIEDFLCLQGHFQC